MMRNVLLAGLCVLGLQGTAEAQPPKARPPAIDLGKAWPNAPDVSRSPHWHVYVFERDGVRYIQVNDRAGRVHGALATAGGDMIVLPMGTDTSRVEQVQAPTAGEIIYNDGAVQLQAMPQPDGTLTISAMSLCTEPVRCSAAL